MDSKPIGTRVTMNPPRILYSFPFRLGAERICSAAWHQVQGTARLGAQVSVSCGSLARPLYDGVGVRTTLGIGKARIPMRLIGRDNSLMLHDWFTARWLHRHHGAIDLVHAWPGAAIQTIRAANMHGIPCVLERPNTHTEYAFTAARMEADRCGVTLPANHDHAFDGKRLEQELIEYSECDYLLCPSDFVEKTFLDRGVAESKILRHQYGYDGERFFPGRASRGSGDNTRLTALYAGVCEPRKGLHYLLEAWFKSGAHRDCKLLICGGFVKEYGDRLMEKLSHPSIEILGHRGDLPEIMRRSDLFILSSVEEGSALVTYEAMASGCVLLVSDSTGAHCVHQMTGLIHGCRDADQLASHIDQMRTNPELLREIRGRSLASARELTWERAGEVLMNAYKVAINGSHRAKLSGIRGMAEQACATSGGL